MEEICIFTGIVSLRTLFVFTNFYENLSCNFLETSVSSSRNRQQSITFPLLSLGKEHIFVFTNVFYDRLFWRNVPFYKFFFTSMPDIRNRKLSKIFPVFFQQNDHIFVIVTIFLWSGVWENTPRNKFLRPKCV
jgi:hypothetical protein